MKPCGETPTDQTDSNGLHVRGMRASFSRTRVGRGTVSERFLSQCEYLIKGLPPRTDCPIALERRKTRPLSRRQGVPACPASQCPGRFARYVPFWTILHCPRWF